MNVKTQNKPLIGIFVAIVLTAALCVTSIGTALALPDEESKTITIGTRTYTPYDDESDVYDNFSHFYFSEHRLKANGDFGWTVAPWEFIIDGNVYQIISMMGEIEGTANLQDYKSGTYYVNFVCRDENSTAVTYKLTIEDSSETLQPDPISFLIHFKATGIQSTGFVDYKAAFAALNGN